MADLDFDAAAHLLRRMGFGGSPEEVEALAARGREGAVDHLINYSGITNTEMDEILEQSFDFSDPRDGQKFNQGEIRRWWFTRMVYTRRQFEEKMTLFWHNHFATALSKVQDALMFIQNQTLRAHALDRFDTLLLKVSQDPAMLIWLDNVTNVLGKPNENFAREINELFTTGITDVVTGEANYTEDDVKAIAAAFTGWKFRANRRSENGFAVEFFIQANQHDNTAKTVFGQTANFGGEDIITILSARKATARFLTKKLFDFFVYPLKDSPADKSTIEKFAAVYMSSDHSIKELVRAIFTSDEFFSDRARFALVKNPVEYVVGAVRMLGAKYNPGAVGRGSSNALAAASRQIGMDVFNPPDVAGWDLNLGFVSTATMLERFNFANALVTNRRPENPGVHVTNEQLAKYTKSSSKKTAKKFLSVLGPLRVSGSTVKMLKEYLEKNDQGNRVEWNVTDAAIDKKVRGLVHQIMSLPEFQLN
jgi:uncharacterized protein (DUF1800 family)